MSWPLNGPFMGGASYDAWKTDPDWDGSISRAEARWERIEQELEDESLEALAEPFGPNFEALADAGASPSPRQVVEQPREEQ